VAIPVLKKSHQNIVLYTITGNDHLFHQVFIIFTVNFVG